MMRVFIVRHGESLATLDPSLFGRTDPTAIPLTQWGHEQALDAGKFIASQLEPSRRLRICYSPHTRIVQSKDAIVSVLPTNVIATIEESSLLREREHGEFNGLNEEQQAHKDPAVFAKLHSKFAHERYTTKMPNGESLEDVHRRMDEFIADLACKVKSDEDVIIVTHGHNCAYLENLLLSPSATWFDTDKRPETGDVLIARTNLDSGGDVWLAHSGKKRSPSTPKDYKIAPYNSGIQLA